MSEAYKEFDARLKKIDKKHSKMASGYSAHVGKDGLVVFRPKRQSSGAPWRALIYLVVGFFIFKAIILAHIGEGIYQERVSELQAGSSIEQAGAYAMQIDPVTEVVAMKLRQLFY